MKLLKVNDHNYWMSLEKKFKSSISAVANTFEIKKQREHFIHFSAHLINSIKTFDITQKVYVDFCPMANNNTGAYWLSKEKEIRNPYFGQDMLTCGIVSQEIQ